MQQHGLHAAPPAFGLCYRWFVPLAWALYRGGATLCLVHVGNVGRQKGLDVTVPVWFGRSSNILISRH